MPDVNDEVVRLLEELATLTELEEADPQAFRVRAYENGARAVAGLARDVRDMSHDDLTEVKGIGSSIASKIREYVETGGIEKLATLREQHPRGQRELLRIPGVGPKTVRLLEEILGVTDVDGLRHAVATHRLRELPGLGAKTEENLARALDRLETAGERGRVPIARALPLAESIVADLAALAPVSDVAYAGSLRRFRDTIGDVDILVATDDPAAVTAAFLDDVTVEEVIGTGETKTSVVTHDGVQVDLRAVQPGHLGAALVYFTGSKAHNIRLRERALERGLTLNEYALAEQDDGEVVAGATEEEVYAALDLPWIPPELREDDGEIEAAAAGELPRLVTVDDLRGDLHYHTDWSGDGRASLEEMLDAAASRGLSYLAITDHAENLTINGIGREGMRSQRRELAEHAEGYDGMVLLHGVELNIGPDGTLDYDQDFRATFDWCVASVHSHFTRPVAEQTDRVLAAMRDPTVNAIGHLTGRRIGTRPGIELDIDAVLDVAVETGTGIEVNGNLARLDAPAAVIREGAARGVTFVISSDAHAPGESENRRHGVHHARRGWLPRERVANTWPTERFLEWVDTVRSGS